MDRPGRTAIADEFMTRYFELKERQVQLDFDTETFYMDVAEWLGYFSAEALAARIGITRHAVYQWAKRGRKAKESREAGNENPDDS